MHYTRGEHNKITPEEKSPGVIPNQTNQKLNVQLPSAHLSLNFFRNALIKINFIN